MYLSINYIYNFLCVFKISIDGSYPFLYQPGKNGAFTGTSRMNVLTEIFQWMKEKKIKILFQERWRLQRDERRLHNNEGRGGTAFTTKSWNVAAEVGET